MELSVSARKVAGIAVLDVSGRLCAGPPLMLLRDAVRKSLEEGTNRIVINLADVTFIDSSGLGELITTHTSVHARGGAMNLLKPSVRISELMKMTRLTNVFELFDEEAQAVQGLKP